MKSDEDLIRISGEKVVKESIISKEPKSSKLKILDIKSSNEKSQNMKSNSKLNNRNDENKLEKDENTQLNSPFPGFKSIEIIETHGEIPYSKAFFVGGIYNRSHLFIQGGIDFYINSISNLIFTFEVKENVFINYNSLSDVDEFMVFNKDLFGHTLELIYYKGEEKFLIFGGFNGMEYSNKAYFIDKSKIIIY